MKKILILYTLFSPALGESQVHSLSFGIGSSCYFGELNRSNSTGFHRIDEIFKTAGWDESLSVEYRYIFEKQLSIGLELSYLKSSADDADNENPTTHPDGISNAHRNLRFTSNVTQVALFGMWEPFRTEQHWDESESWHVSPYLKCGIGLFYFNPRATINDKEYNLQPLGTEGQGLSGYHDKYSRISLSIPGSLGINFTHPNRRFAIGIESTIRYLFTDYLDDVGGYYAKPADFAGVYGPGSVNAQLADRSVEPNLPGSWRGDPSQNDGIWTGQVKFTWFMRNGSSDFGCARF